MTKNEARAIDMICEKVHDLAHEKGWWSEPGSAVGYIPEKIALIHSELSEALECYRNGDMAETIAADGKPEGFGTELADAIIRICDLYEAVYRRTGHIMKPLGTLLVHKHRYNGTRAFRHGGKRA